ncbi:MAG TPA: LD-carboxypeptidase, partial [Vicingus sp.]|nr:LD-carboxypeptidase [Vicingus sp.]
PIYTTENHKLNRLGEATGELVGGNLSIIYSLTGTPSQLDTKGKILFLEDLDEYLYHIDRMMMNLKRAGMLTNLKGLIVGGMSDMKDNTVPFGKSALEIIFDAVKEYHYPVCFDFPAGHVNDNRSLIMGSEVNLMIENNLSTLSFI